MAKLIYDCTVLQIEEELLKNLETYAIGIMNAARQKEPKTAWCWNVCCIIFEDLQPSFHWGGSLEDVIEHHLGNSIIVYHPEQIKKK